MRNNLALAIIASSLSAVVQAEPVAKVDIAPSSLTPTGPCPASTSDLARQVKPLKLLPEQKSKDALAIDPSGARVLGVEPIQMSVILRERRVSAFLAIIPKITPEQLRAAFGPTLPQGAMCGRWSCNWTAKSRGWIGDLEWGTINPTDDLKGFKLLCSYATR